MLTVSKIQRVTSLVTFRNIIWYSLIIMKICAGLERDLCNTQLLVF